MNRASFPRDPELAEWLTDVRRDFHMHPEVSGQEMRTTEVIAETLEKIGVEAQRIPLMTGLVGLIRGTGDGPVIGLRADIDALPIQERSETPYASRNEGVMHACGHDANTAIMLGVAKKIVDTGFMSGRKGYIKFFFQPSEERGLGALAMIDRGVLENPRVDRIIAGHMSPDLSVGSAGVFRGKGYASADRFSLTVTGKGAHGARPEEGNDPIVAASAFVQLVQTIVSRNVKPTESAVVTVGTFSAPGAANVIPESAHLEGSIRALTENVRRAVHHRLQEIVLGLERTFGVRCDFKITEGVPVLTNDIDVADALHRATGVVLGEENAHYLPPIMGSEDFSYFTLERPSAIMRLGCSNKKKEIDAPLHSPWFDIDETVLEIGVEIFYEAVKRFFDSE